MLHNALTLLLTLLFSCYSLASVPVTSPPIASMPVTSLPGTDYSSALAKETRTTEPPSDSVPPQQLVMLHDYVESVRQELDAIRAVGPEISSSISRTMLLNQFESLTTESSQQVLDYAHSSEAKANSQHTISLLRSQAELVNRQQTRARGILTTLFRNFEKAGIEDQPIQWMTVSNGIDYRTKLLKLELKLIQTLEGLGADIRQSQADAKRHLEKIAANMYVVLNSSLRLTKVLQMESRRIPPEQRNGIEARLRMQQRMNQTFSDNLKALIPLMEYHGTDTTRYNEITFSASGELSGVVSSAEAFLTILRKLLDNAAHWLSENASHAVSEVCILLLLLLGFNYLSRLFKRVVIKVVRAPQSHLSTLVQNFIISISAKLIMLIGILVALSQIGFNLGPLFTGLGVAGIVIGFALQDTLSNFAAGMMILIYRPFDVEDIVEAGGVDGMVSHMSLVNTTIRTFDNQIFIVPNSCIWGNTIKNITAEKQRRVDMVFSIGYGDDIDQAEQLLIQILHEHPRVLRSPAPIVKVMTLNHSSVDFVVRPWVKTAHYWDVYWDITKTVKQRFDQSGITIPFPQQEVHIRRT